MRFLLDHDVPDEAAQVLRHWGHEVHPLREVLPVTATDERVFAVAQEAGLVILSCNRGHFLGLASAAASRGEAFSGLIILIRRRTRQAECAHLLSLLRRAGDAGLKGNINFA